MLTSTNLPLANKPTRHGYDICRNYSLYVVGQSGITKEISLRNKFGTLADKNVIDLSLLFKLTNYCMSESFRIKIEFQFVLSVISEVFILPAWHVFLNRTEMNSHVYLRHYVLQWNNISWIYWCLKVMVRGPSRSRLEFWLQYQKVIVALWYLKCVRV